MESLEGDISILTLDMLGGEFVFLLRQKVFTLV